MINALATTSMLFLPALIPPHAHPVPQVQQQAENDRATPPDQAAAEAPDKVLVIVAVEQVGRPPYNPNEGRVYRLSGQLTGVKAGDVLSLKRPNSSAYLGLLRVISIDAPDEALARVDVRGATFPLKGDQAYPMSPLGLPEIDSGSPPFFPGDAIAPPLNPLLLPSLPTGGAGGVVSIVLPPVEPRTMEEIEAGRPNPLYPGATPPQQTAERPRLLEQNPIYFLRDSSAVSPKGIEKLIEWVATWGKKGPKYFLAVPQDQLHLEKKTVERLAALERELASLGVTDVEYRMAAPADDGGPFDVVYVGVEGN